MDMYDFNRQFNNGIGDETQDYKMKSIPHIYPQMAAMPNLMPANIIPVPMMTFRPGAEMDYNHWLNSNYPHPYRNNGYYETHSLPHTRSFESHPSMDLMQDYYQEEADDLSPQLNGPSSPRFGPGPPIVTSERVKGPHGCNLFVFHLPNEITNWDLYLLFRKYGTILSVHTMINKTTGLSKGYGFISYSARDEARLAISAMDGYRLGKKRLKVQVKRSQEDANDHDGDGENNSVFDSVPFTGENSGITTRASTPHGLHPHSALHSRNASTSNSGDSGSGRESGEGDRDGDDENDCGNSGESGESGDSGDSGESGDGGNGDESGEKGVISGLSGDSGATSCAVGNTGADRDDTNRTDALLATVVSSISLTAVTPAQAEANMKNSCKLSTTHQPLHYHQRQHHHQGQGQGLYRSRLNPQLTTQLSTTGATPSASAITTEGSNTSSPNSRTAHSHAHVLVQEKKVIVG